MVSMYDVCYYFLDKMHLKNNKIHKKYNTCKSIGKGEIASNYASTRIL